MCKKCDGSSGVERLRIYKYLIQNWRWKDKYWIQSGWEQSMQRSAVISFSVLWILWHKSDVGFS